MVVGYKETIDLSKRHILCMQVYSEMRLTILLPYFACKYERVLNIMSFVDVRRKKYVQIEEIYITKPKDLDV